MPTPQTFSYKSFSSSPQLSLDVYLPPTTSSSLPILLWIHGGGLFISNRTGIAPHVKRAAAAHEICVVSIGYRLAPQVGLKEIVEDVVDSTKWIREELSERIGGRRIDLTKLAVGGSSSGGYLALLMGHPALGLRLLPKSILTMYPISDPLGSWFTTKHPPSETETRVASAEMESHLDLDAPVLAGTESPSGGDRARLYTYTLQEGNWDKTVGKGTELKDY